MRPAWESGCAWAEEAALFQLGMGATRHEPQWSGKSCLAYVGGAVPHGASRGKVIGAAVRRLRHAGAGCAAATMAGAVAAVAKTMAATVDRDGRPNRERVRGRFVHLGAESMALVGSTEASGEWLGLTVQRQLVSTVASPQL